MGHLGQNPITMTGRFKCKICGWRGEGAPDKIVCTPATDVCGKHSCMKAAGICKCPACVGIEFTPITSLVLSEDPPTRRRDNTKYAILINGIKVNTSPTFYRAIRAMANSLLAGGGGWIHKSNLIDASGDATMSIYASRWRGWIRDAVWSELFESDYRGNWRLTVSPSAIKIESGNSVYNREPK